MARRAGFHRIRITEPASDTSHSPAGAGHHTKLCLRAALWRVAGDRNRRVPSYLAMRRGACAV